MPIKSRRHNRHPTTTDFHPLWRDNCHILMSHHLRIPLNHMTPEMTNSSRPTSSIVARPLPARKFIALVAHDARKAKLLEWCRSHRAKLKRHALCATESTGELLQMEIWLPIEKLKSGPLGGYQEMGAKIARGEIHVVIFFWAPLNRHPLTADVKALLRLANLYNIPVAYNTATADFMIASPLFNQKYRGQAKLPPSQIEDEPYYAKLRQEQPKRAQEGPPKPAPKQHTDELTRKHMESDENSPKWPPPPKNLPKHAAPAAKDSMISNSSTDRDEEQFYADDQTNRANSRLDTLRFHMPTKYHPLKFTPWRSMYSLPEM